VEQQRAAAAAEVAPQVVRQLAAELASVVEATQNEPAAEAPRPSSSLIPDSLLAAAVVVALLQAVESAVRPRAAVLAESAVRPRAAPVVELEALVAHLNSTAIPRSCRDRNWGATGPAARAR
jgi:hypothetical protein